MFYFTCDRSLRRPSTSGWDHGDRWRLKATGREVGHVTVLWRHGEALQHSCAVALSLGSEQCDALSSSVLLLAAVWCSVVRWCVDVCHQPVESVLASSLFFFLQLLRSFDRLLVHTCIHRIQSQHTDKVKVKYSRWFISRFFAIRQNRFRTALQYSPC